MAVNPVKTVASCDRCSVRAGDFQSVFNRLRVILQKHRGNLSVSVDSPRYYCLTGSCHPTRKGPYPIAWVEISKAYVGFHHMGVYCSPELLADVSKKLKARMQGKSCFNFKTVDEPLFEELEQLTVQAFESFKTKMSAYKSKGIGA
jgi:hypothetical protein